MARSRTKKEQVKKLSQLQVINPNVAGIDVSDTEMMTAYPIKSGQLVVRAFGCFTSDLHLIARCFKDNVITSVAMESTGVYWIA